MVLFFVRVALGWLSVIVFQVLDRDVAYMIFLRESMVCIDGFVS